jgi:hypothetical protein
MKFVIICIKINRNIINLQSVVWASLIIGCWTAYILQGDTDQIKLRYLMGTLPIFHTF